MAAERLRDIVRPQVTPQEQREPLEVDALGGQRRDRGWGCSPPRHGAVPGGSRGCGGLTSPWRCWDRAPPLSKSCSTSCTFLLLSAGTGAGRAAPVRAHTRVPRPDTCACGQARTHVRVKRLRSVCVRAELSQATPMHTKPPPPMHTRVRGRSCTCTLV